MWIFTVNGFFTVIQDRKDANYVWLRARLREDIERNFPGVTAEEHPGADYLFRVKLPREQVAQRLFELTMENNVTSHFKDVMIRTASKPKYGSRSSMLYGVWNAGAAMQPIPPYGKIPRPEPKPVVSTDQRWKAGDRSVSRGQNALFSRDGENRGLYGGAGAGYKGSEFDWDSKSWGGTSSPDPALPSSAPASDEDDLWWETLSPEEQQAYLDEAEDQLRRQEATEVGSVELVDVLPAPANRPGTRRQRRKEKRNRHNRHNQMSSTAQYERRAQEARDGLRGQEEQNRQAFLDKRTKGSN